MAEFLHYQDIDHIAYIFNCLEDGYDFFRQHKGFRVIKGPGKNIKQKVEYLFIFVEKIGIIEILSPYGKNSPIKKRLEEFGPGFYHICYSVENIEKNIEKLLNSKDWKVICSPVKDIAFDGRKVAFLSNKKIGLIELVEGTLKFNEESSSIPKFDENQNYIYESQNQKDKEKEKISLSASIKNEYIPNEIYKIIINSLEEELIISDQIKSFQEIDQWDSLSFAIFHASFESLINKNIPFKENQDLSFYIDYYYQIKK
tara:strand:+ start:69514 stop:70284 length:771 start_codon:yes stop_codon:yes gene_type:complete